MTLHGQGVPGSELVGSYVHGLLEHFGSLDHGESITPGEPWLQEIFDKLSVAALGVPLVSSNYFASGNCEHEALEMVAKRDSTEFSMIPLKLYADDVFERPTWMSHRQYMHYYDYNDVETVADRLIEFFDRSMNKKNL